MPTSIQVKGFPDLLSLRDPHGKEMGLFSDHGSWLGVTWGEDQLFEIRDLATQELHHLDLGSPVLAKTVWPDRIEFELTNGTKGVLGFCNQDSIGLQLHGSEVPRVSSSLAFEVAAQSSDNFEIGLALTTQDIAIPKPNHFQQNRQRWNDYFETASTTHLNNADANRPLLLARAITTLIWNWRGPKDRLRHSGVIPSPFAYCGYWAWDSWKHARALASFAPQLAAEMLRAQFSRQRADGMVPDTVMLDPADDNWLNTKPPLAAWALLHLLNKGADPNLASELYPNCAAQMDWFCRNRRMPNETLFRAGGMCHETATWDTGWDLCARFDGVALHPHGPWKLFDQWSADFNAYCYNEFRSLEKLAIRLGLDASPWRKQAEQLGTAIQQQLWEESLGGFADRTASTGNSTGILSAATWLPVWAGAATTEQRQSVQRILQSESDFNTPMPFPVLAASAAAFDPDGYWNGAVWADHAALALAVSNDRTAVQSARLLEHLAKHQTLYECYSPLTGQAANGRRPAVSQFSWTAAAVLMMLES